MFSLVALVCLITGTMAKMNLYLSSDQTEKLYGIKTDGLYYVMDGMVNQYAMTFQHQAIPADIDHIDFTWSATPRSAIPYKITFIHTPGPAMDPPKVNVSLSGLVPTHEDKFRLYFPCTGKAAAEVDTLLQISLALVPGKPQLLTFKRRKVCKLEDEVLIEPAAEPSGLPEDPSQSVLLASVSPSMLVALGAGSASMLLVTVLLATLYLRRIRKRSIPLGGSLRSSMHLHSDQDYTEKATATTAMSSCDSYATLASFTQVPVSRTEAPGWARFSSPSVADYSIPAPPKSPWQGGSSHVPSPRPHVPRHHAASLGSLHSSLVYDSTARGAFFSHFSPGKNKTTSRQGPLYENVENHGHVQMANNFPQYEYSTAGAGYGEASPYSVSSELYKHVLPQYFQFNRPSSRGSVLV